MSYLITVGSLVNHRPESWEGYGPGIVIYAWKINSGHDPEDIMVLFSCGEKMVNLRSLDRLD